MHKKFFREGVADGRSCQLLRAGLLAKSAEVFLFEAKEQGLRTKLFRRAIVGEDVAAECQVCGNSGQSVGNLVAVCRCSGLVQREYSRRHNRMGLFKLIRLT